MRICCCGFAIPFHSSPALLCDLFLCFTKILKCFHGGFGRMSINNNCHQFPTGCSVLFGCVLPRFKHTFFLFAVLTIRARGSAKKKMHASVRNCRRFIKSRIERLPLPWRLIIGLPSTSLSRQQFHGELFKFFRFRNFAAF